MASNDNLSGLVTQILELLKSNNGSTLNDKEIGRIKEKRDSSSNELKIWYYRLEDCSYNLKDAKSAFQQDRNALSVVSALIMTIGFAGLVLTPTDFEGTAWSGALQYIIPFLWAVASFTSMLCVWSSSFESITVMHVKDEDYIKYLEDVVSICVSPFSYMKWSMFSLLLAVSFQVISLDTMLYPGLMVLGMAVVTAILGQRHEYKVNKFVGRKINASSTNTTTWRDLLKLVRWPDIIYRGICGRVDTAAALIHKCTDLCLCLVLVMVTNILLVLYRIRIFSKAIWIRSDDD